jgi:HEAT repeat protein
VIPVKWIALITSLGLCFSATDCGEAVSTEHFQRATLPARTVRANDNAAGTVRETKSRPWDSGTPIERLARVRKLAADGPDKEGATETLVEALDDDDNALKKVAAVALISFGETALGPLRKKLPPRDTAPSKAPNPHKAPVEFLGLDDLIVSWNPWFAGAIFPAAEELAQDKEPALRIEGVRALLVGAGTQEERVREALQTAAKAPDEKVREALQTAAKDPDEKVREAAKDTLKRVDDRPLKRK